MKENTTAKVIWAYTYFTLLAYKLNPRAKFGEHVVFCTDFTRNYMWVLC